MMMEVSLPQHIQRLKDASRMNKQYIEHLYILEEASITSNSIELVWQPPTKNADRITDFQVASLAFYVVQCPVTCSCLMLYCYSMYIHSGTCILCNIVNGLTVRTGEDGDNKRYGVGVVRGLEPQVQGPQPEAAHAVHILRKSKL